MEVNRVASVAERGILAKGGFLFFIFIFYFWIYSTRQLELLMMFRKIAAVVGEKCLCNDRVVVSGDFLELYQ